MGDTFANPNDLTIEFETISYGGKTYKLIGLAPIHLTYLVRHQKAALEEIYQKAASGELSDDINGIVLDLAEKAPRLCAMVIACGMDAPLKHETFLSLPMSVQAEALNKIVRLTLTAEGGLEKLMEIVTGGLAGVASLTSPKA